MRELSLKKTGLTVLAFCVGFILLAVIARHVARERDAISSRPEAFYPIKRVVQYGYTLQNETNRLLEKAEFWTYAPVKQTATQRCENLEGSHPYELITDDLGNQILHFTLANLPPHGARIVMIKAELSLSETPRKPFPQQADGFLQPEKYIEADHPEILQLARKLKAPKTETTVRNIFDYVAGNIRYTGYVRNDQGALYALRKKQGDCTEYMYLFTALCRANQIPARGLGGYVCKGDAVLKASDYHNWAEFYQDGIWRLADPQKKVFMQNPSQYIAMRVIADATDEAKNPMGTFHRFRFVGDGLKVRMNQ
jgi:transglutaminase-like putative cysteine protease